jgi:predicted porin
VQAAVGLGEAVASRSNGFNVEYGAGPIYAALGYEKLSKGPAATDGNSIFNLAFHYDFGFLKPMAYYGRAKVAGGTQTNKVITLGILAPIGGGTLKAAYGRLTPDAANTTGTGRESKFGIGYDYALSKRTNLYVDLGSGRKGGTVGNVVGGTSWTNNTAYALGVKHTF